MGDGIDLDRAGNAKRTLALLGSFLFSRSGLVQTVNEGGPSITDSPGP